MRARYTLLIVGVLMLLVSLTALAKVNQVDSILGMSIGDKIESAPESPTLYLIIIAVLGAIAVLLSIFERKVYE